MNSARFLLSAPADTVFGLVRGLGEGWPVFTGSAGFHSRKLGIPMVVKVKHLLLIDFIVLLVL
jgi:hypothetical protein